MPKSQVTSIKTGMHRQVRTNRSILCASGSPPRRRVTTWRSSDEALRQCGGHIACRILVIVVEL